MGYKRNESQSTNLYDRVKKLLVSYEWSDCSFNVAGKDIKAHKLILGISSPVFEAMFYGPFTNTENIVITDIEPDIFQLLLNYIYTDKVEISSIEQAFELLYASRKYILEDLTELCIAYIQDNISIDNVVSVLNYPDHMHDKQLISFSIKLFCEHAQYLFKEYKQSITISCIKSILESNSINLKEKDLIKHVFQWAGVICEQTGLKNIIENKRKILIDNDLFHLLRFSTLSLDDLGKVYTDNNNLLLSTELEAFKEVIKNNKCDLLSIPFDSSLVSRNSLKLNWCLCHRSPLRSAAPVVIDANNFVIHSRIKTSKSVFINSLCVPTRTTPVLSFSNNSNRMYSEQISVSVLCESDNSIIKFTNFMNTVEYDSNVNIELSEPCLLKKDEWYKISFVWPQNRLNTYSYVLECRDRYFIDHKLTFEFDDLSVVGNYGSFLGGLKFCL